MELSIIHEFIDRATCRHYISLVFLDPAQSGKNKNLEKLRLSDERNNELKAGMDLKSKRTLFAFSSDCHIIAAILDVSLQIYQASNYIYM